MALVKTLPIKLLALVVLAATCAHAQKNNAAANRAAGRAASFFFGGGGGGIEPVPLTSNIDPANIDYLFNQTAWKKWVDLLNLGSTPDIEEYSVATTVLGFNLEYAAGGGSVAAIANARLSNEALIDSVNPFLATKFTVKAGTYNNFQTSTTVQNQNRLPQNPVTFAPDGNVCTVTISIPGKDITGKKKFCLYLWTGTAATLSKSFTTTQSAITFVGTGRKSIGQWTCTIDPASQQQADDCIFFPEVITP